MSVSGEGGIRIDRCICRGMPFADLLELARASGWDLDALGAATGCGCRCGLCRPYLRRMLSDGTTVFRELLPSDEEAR
ncbi:MAG TPA: hypothetical protein PLL69_12090 [Gemmatimonadales bacterium]|nr:hypothetical protein [Gemmatimonadales bacterium]